MPPSPSVAPPDSSAVFRADPTSPLSVKEDHPGYRDERSTHAEIPGPNQTRACNDPWTYVQVLGDGAVRPCCFSGVVLGVVSDTQNFADVFNGEPAQRLRQQLLTGDLDKYCRICNMKAVMPVKEFQQEIVKLYDGPSVMRRLGDMPLLRFIGRMIFPLSLRNFLNRSFR